MSDWRASNLSTGPQECSPAAASADYNWTGDDPAAVQCKCGTQDYVELTNVPKEKKPELQYPEKEKAAKSKTRRLLVVS